MTTSMSSTGTSATWLRTTVGELCDKHGGSVQTGPFGSQLHASDYAEAGTPIVMPQDMNDGRIHTGKIARVASANASRLKQHALRAGDVVFSRRGDVSRFAVVTEAEAGWLCGTGSIRIRLNSLDVDIAYLRRYLQQDSIGDWLRHEAKGVTMPNLNTGIVREIPLVCPPLSEQRRIAAILDQADALRTKRRASVAHLEALRHSTFHEMFGGPEEILRRWTVVPLGQLVDFMTSGSRGWAEYYRDSGSVFLRINNVRDDELVLDDVVLVAAPANAEARRTLVHAGDVLLSITADLGRTAVVPEELHQRAHINQHLCILRSSKLMGRFLSAYLRSPAGQREVLGRNKQAVKAGLNFDDIRSFRIPLPPIELQKAFADAAQRIDALKRSQQASLAKLRGLFASLQHRAFSGQL